MDYNQAVSIAAKVLLDKEKEGYRIYGRRLEGVACIMLGMVQKDGFVSVDEAIADILHECFKQAGKID